MPLKKQETRLRASREETVWLSLINSKKNGRTATSRLGQKSFGVLHLPKAQERRDHRHAVQQEKFRDQWGPYLQELEAGGPVRLRDLYQEMLEADTGQDGNSGLTCLLDEVPTLVQIENSLRATGPGKACGPEGLSSE